MQQQTEKYREKLNELNLNQEQAEQLIGALTFIAERFLDEKYLLGKEKHDC